MDQPEIISRKEAMARGLKRYFTGKPCKRGHVGERAVNGGCPLCQYERARKWHFENLEAERERTRKWRCENRDAVLVAERKRRLENLDVERAKDRARYLKNRDAECAASKQWRLKNGDVVREMARRQRVELSRTYVAKVLGITVLQMPDELYNMKRDQLEFHRLQIELNRELKRLTK